MALPVSIRHVRQYVTMFKTGDPVIYRVSKNSRSPGPRALAVIPAPAGEDYRYVVDKFWVVDRVLEDGQLVLRTRRGKEHIVASRDPRLRRPWFWERWLYRSKFPLVTEGTTRG